MCRKTDLFETNILENRKLSEINTKRSQQLSLHVDSSLREEKTQFDILLDKISRSVHYLIWLSFTQNN